MSKIDNLLTWAKSNGAKISPNIDFKELSPGNHGAISTLHENAIIEVPSALIFTCKEAEKLFGTQATKNSISINSPPVLLKLYLAYARVHETFFDPYIQSLPDLETIDPPTVWDSQDKQLIKGTNLGSSLRDILGTIVDEWWEAINALPETVQKPEEHFINMKFYYEFKFHTDDELYEVVQNTKKENWTAFGNYLWANLIFKSRAFPASLLVNTKGLKTGKEEPELEVELEVESETESRSETKLNPDLESLSIANTVPDPSALPILLPIVDLLNHQPSAKVKWTGFDVKNSSKNGAEGEDNIGFRFETEEPVSKGNQIFNNYGLKGNEELLSAYGFTIENNELDVVALKIQIPDVVIDMVEKSGIKLPKIEDYTNSISAQKDMAKDGVLFFISASHIPNSLIQLFQILIRNPLEGGSITSRMKLAGLNALRDALVRKKELIKLDVPEDTTRRKYIKNYVVGQNHVLSSAIKEIKRREKDLLSEFKSLLITLKKIFKEDEKFQKSLLYLGLDNDRIMLLWIMRVNNTQSPEWIASLFTKLRQKSDITAQDVLNFTPIHDEIMPRLVLLAPEIYGEGDWSVGDFATAAKLLDMISFSRGKEKECIIVKQDYNL